ncbi:MAG: pyruvate dehydrogenase (acetyl-transferring) E1 component subunit alpha, partial [Desulfobacterales bacterium]
MEKVSERAPGYGIPGITVDGNDVMAVFAAVEDAVDRARSGDGPTLVENITYRWRGHSRSDINRYRTKDEIEAWKEKCPIKHFRTLLIGEGVLSEGEAENVEKDAYTNIEAAVEFAEASPEPDLSTIEEGVY